MDIIQFLVDLFLIWGVSFEAAAAASAFVFMLMGFLTARGWVFPDLTVFGQTFSGTLLTTLLVSLLLGGYAQFEAGGFVVLPVLGGGVLTFLMAAGVYDATIKQLRTYELETIEEFS